MESQEPAAKKPTTSEADGEEHSPAPAPLSSLEGFNLERILSEDSSGKFVALLGSFKGDPPGKQAIVKLAKRHFPLDQLSQLFASKSMPLELDFHNDIYCKVRSTSTPRPALFFNV